MSAPEDAALKEAAKAKVLEVMDMYVAAPSPPPQSFGYR